MYYTLSKEDPGKPLLLMGHPMVGPLAKLDPNFIDVTLCLSLCRVEDSPWKAFPRRPCRSVSSFSFVFHLVHPVVSKASLKKMEPPMRQT